MKAGKLVRAAIGLALLSSGVAASADVLSFSGTLTGLAVAGPDATCAPLPFRGTISSSTTVGQSSLGDFTYSHNICLSGPSGPSGGSFIIDFGTDSFFGTLDGGATPTAIPGIADVSWTYTLLGGTGRFLDASGVFTGVGTNDARTRPSQLSLTLSGNIDAPAVPEPGTWAMMLLGFGALGLKLRFSRRSVPTLSQIA
jgi:hypothetical protein